MDISKVQMPNGEVYEFKDAQVRHDIAVLLGLETNDEEIDENEGEKE